MIYTSISKYLILILCAITAFVIYCDKVLAYTTDISVSIVCGVLIKDSGPEAPVLHDPGEVNDTGIFTLSWASSAMDSFELQEDISDLFSSPTVYYISGTSLDKQFTDHELGQFYYRIRGIDPKQNITEWSNVVDIIVEKKLYNYITFEAEDLYNPYFKKGSEIPICLNSSDQHSPSIYENLVVWSDYRNDGNNETDIYLFDLDTNEEKPICLAESWQENPEIYGDIVVWEDYRNGGSDIYSYNLKTGEEKPICIAEGDQGNPRIFKDKIVWEDYRNGNGDIYLYDLYSNLEKAICVDPYDQTHPVIYSDKIVWEDLRLGDMDIFMYDVRTGVEMPICVEFFDQESPQIYDSRIVWVDTRNYDISGLDIFSFDLKTNTESALDVNSLDQHSPSIYDGKIAWIEDGEYTSDLYVYDLVLGNKVLIEEDVTWEAMPQFNKNSIVYKSGPYSSGDISLCNITSYPNIAFDKPLEAWAGAYLVSQNNTNNGYTYSANIPKDGDYYVWVRMASDTDHSDSFRMSIQGNDDVMIGDLAEDNSTDLRWINYKNGLVDNRIIVHLAAGTNLIGFNDVEPLSKIDSFIITDDPDYIPPDMPPSVKNWEAIEENGFGTKNNFTSRIKVLRDNLYASTSSVSYQPSIYKTTNGRIFSKDFELRTNINDGINMYRSLEMEAVNGQDLYIVSDNYWGGLYITQKSDSASYSTNLVGNRGWWTKDLISYKENIYAGFYNDWNLNFVMKRTPDPMDNSSWVDVSRPAFSEGYYIMRKLIKDKWIERIVSTQYANLTAESSIIFKGKLYIGTYNYGYLGRTTDGAQIWRTSDGITWEPVLLDGFNDKDNRSITAMAVFGGYLYAATNKAFEPCKIYKTDGEYHNGKISWEPVVLDGFGRLYNTYVSSFVSYMGRLYAATSSWSYSSSIPKESYSGGVVYSSKNGQIWQADSLNGITSLDNITLENIEIFRGHLYVNTRNSVTGTQIIRAEVK